MFHVLSHEVDDHSDGHLLEKDYQRLHEARLVDSSRVIFEIFLGKALLRRPCHCLVWRPGALQF